MKEKGEWAVMLLVVFPVAMLSLWVIVIFALVVTSHMVGEAESQALMGIAKYVLAGPLEWITH